MLTRARWAALATALALAACGADAADTGSRAAPSPPSAPAPSAAQEDPLTDPGAFPSEAALREQFEDPASGWPAAGYADGRYRVAVEGGRPFATVAAPVAIEPPLSGVFVEAEVTSTAGTGRAGLHCRGSQDGETLYALSIGADGSWAMERYEGGVGALLDGGTLPDTVLGDPGEPNLLRLICGSAAPGTAVSLVFTVNATQYLTVTDPVALDPGPSSTAGLFVSGAGEAAYDNLALWVAEAGG